VLRFLATQLVLQADDLLAYASREETRHEHLAILRRIYTVEKEAKRRVRLAPFYDSRPEDLERGRCSEERSCIGRGGA
jgi:hypothetical protein